MVQWLSFQAQAEEFHHLIHPRTWSRPLSNRMPSLGTDARLPIGLAGLASLASGCRVFCPALPDERLNNLRRLQRGEATQIFQDQPQTPQHGTSSGKAPIPNSSALEAPVRSYAVLHVRAEASSMPARGLPGLGCRYCSKMILAASVATCFAS